MLDQISAEGRLAAAARGLVDQLRGVRRRPLPLLDAMLGWVVRESSAFRPAVAERVPYLRTRWVDAALVIAAVAPVAVVVLA